MKTKKCTKCGEVKTFDEFYNATKSKDGLDYHCKSCEKKRKRLAAEKKGVKPAFKPFINKYGKQCTRCNEFKPYNEFSNHTQNKTGKHPQCKSCRSEDRIAKRLKGNGGEPLVYSLTKKGKDESKLLFKNGLKKCRDCGEIKSINDFYTTTSSDSADGLLNQCKDCNKKLSNKYREENRDKVNRKQREYKKNNPGYKTKEKREWAKKKIANDPLFAMMTRLRGRACRAFRDKGWSKTSKTQEMLGCSWDVVKGHMESQFTDGMSWGKPKRMAHRPYYSSRLSKYKGRTYLPMPLPKLTAFMGRG